MGTRRDSRGGRARWIIPRSGGGEGEIVAREFHNSPNIILAVVEPM